MTDTSTAANAAIESAPEETLAKELRENSVALGASAILGADDLAIEKLDVPEWGGHIFIKSMNGDEMNKFSSLIKGDAAQQTFPLEAVALTCALTMCNERGARIFPDEMQGASQLKSKNAKVLNRIFLASLRLSSLSADSSVEDSPGND